MPWPPTGTGAPEPVTRLSLGSSRQGINAALTDIQSEHPNDLASVMFYSGLNGYSTARVGMSKNFTMMQNCLFFPFPLAWHAF